MSLFSPCNFLLQWICPSKLSPLKLFAFSSCESFLWSVRFSIFWGPVIMSGLKHIPIHQISTSSPKCLRKLGTLILGSLSFWWWLQLNDLQGLMFLCCQYGTALVLIVSFQEYSIVYLHCIYVVNLLSEKASIEESLRVNCYFMPRTPVTY